MKIDKQFRNILLIYSLVIIFAITTLIYRYITGSDIKVLKIDYYDCNGWCVLHFINYLLLGFFAPKYWKLIILIGILFEFFEYILQKYFQYIKFKLIKDPIINTIGLFVGIGINKLYYS